ncbi:MAG: hypothetical protein WAM75_07820 [Xanthobacteraceae bacterium]
MLRVPSPRMGVKIAATSGEDLRNAIARKCRCGERRRSQGAIGLARRGAPIRAVRYIFRPTQARLDLPDLVLDQFDIVDEVVDGIGERVELLAVIDFVSGAPSGLLNFGS